MALPSGYTQLEYIESSGTQYIDTGITISSTTYKQLRFVLDNEYLSFDGSYWLVNGCSGNGVVYYFGAATGGAIYYGNGTADISANGTASTGRQTIEFDPTNGRYVFGSTLSLTGLTFNAPTGSSNFHLFAYNKGSASDCHTERIYSCQIYSQGSLVRNFIPAERISDSVIGLYDTVNSVFYTNAGTGNFIAGSPVEPLSLYTQLKYIQSTGTQYINTGFAPNQNTKIIADMAYFGESEKSIFGAYDYQSIFRQYNFGLTVNSDKNFVFVWRAGRVTGPTYDQNRHLFELYQATLLVDGTSYGSSSTSTFSISNPITIFAYNQGSSVGCSSCKIYAFKIYDNGTLVRDLIPAKRNSDGEIGLYDLVNGIFFTNSGTGTFIAGYNSSGSNNSTLIDGVSHKITGGKCLVDGTVYNIKNGRTMIDGTIFQISFGSTHTITIDGYMQSKYADVQIGDTTITQTGTYTIDSSGELELTVYAKSQKKDDGTTYYSYVNLNGASVASETNITYTLKNIDEKNINISFNWNDVNLYYVVKITTSN